jgi:serine/threonine protein kinase
MGIVHQGTSRHGSKVVIKEPIFNGDQDQIKLQKLKVEAQILKELNHPCIVKYLDEKDETRNFFLVIEFVYGNTLKGKYFRKPCDEATTKLIAEHVLDSLTVIHQHNIIHRDINPKNILTQPGGEVKLIDFGGAKHGYNQIDPSSGTVLGTPGYMAPEQLAGFATPQSDIYGLGMTMFFLLTGDDPQFHMRDRLDVPDPKQANPRVSERMRDVVMKATQPEPPRRQRSADEMLNELRGVTKPSYSPHLVMVGRNFLIRGSMTIGRSQNSTVFLDDREMYISRTHARIYEDSGSFWVEDMGSLNGTFIRQSSGSWKRIQKQRLQDGDMIALCYQPAKGAWVTGTFAMN